MKKERKKHAEKNKKPSSDSCLFGCTGINCMGMQEIPLSPPPSYEYSLQESGPSSENCQVVTDEENCVGNDDGQIISEVCSDVNCHCGSPVRQEIFHKSSKEFYKAVAAQWGGLPCKMTENCRCLECQSRYFECDYDQENEQDKTDGGLGAGTPMFLTEVMHGSTCTLI